ncbi:MAG TPA: branched-chain amino acid transaminase [Coleofasciculaceae cyanobacterium]|jgi:branched-chain amino acid aminotransferase
MEYIYFEGKFVPSEEAKISVKTHAFLYGTSLFEGIRGYWLPEQRQIAVFRMEDHYKRLLSNSVIFYMQPKLSLEQINQITVELIQRNRPDSDIYIRPTLYKATEHVTPTLEETLTDFCLWTKPFGNYLDLDKGLKVMVSSWRRIPDNAIPARAKAGGAYMNTALAVTDARKMGFDDAIFLTEAGTVSEGSAMNLFLVKNGQLVTPSKTEDILEGITRDSLITLAKDELGLETVERSIDRSELYHADEAFFCGTGAQVAPITSIDHRPIGDGEFGPITRKIQSLYFDVVKNKVPQYRHWVTLVQL